MNTPKTLPLADIIIGERARQDLGDITALTESMREIGLLQPVAVTPEGQLIAGQRRLAAALELGWTEIPVNIVDLDAVRRGERDENLLRKAFSPSEEVAIFEAALAEERELAKARQGARTDIVENVHEVEGGKARDLAARGLGRSGRTLEMASQVVRAADAEPTKFARLKEQMDQTGRVNNAYKQLMNMKKATAIAQEPPPLPGKGPYRVIVADPPWPFDARANDLTRRIWPYPFMPIEQIRALPVPSIAHADCVLFLWTTNAHLPDSFTVLAAWGFEYKTVLTWAKDRMSLGGWLRNQTEQCLLAVRGRPTVTLKDQTTLLTSPVGEHSAKPDAFYALVESLCPAPRYAELFQRRPRPSWDGHGDEVVPANDNNATTDDSGSEPDGTPEP